MQAVALFPGVSRSGSTIAGGLALSVGRREAAAFSFLMSLPAILGSVVLQGYEVFKEQALPADILPTVIGTACAAVSGFFAIKFMIALVSKRNCTVLPSMWRCWDFGYCWISTCFTYKLGIIIEANHITRGCCHAGFFPLSRTGRR